MVLLSILPVGLLQAWASVEYGTWHARAAEFLQTGFMDKLRWMRVVRDSIFAFGALVLGWFVLGLLTGRSFDRRAEVREGGADVHPLPERAMGD